MRPELQNKPISHRDQHDWSWPTIGGRRTQRYLLEGEQRPEYAAAPDTDTALPRTEQRGQWKNHRRCRRRMIIAQRIRTDARRQHRQKDAEDIGALQDLDKRSWFADQRECRSPTSFSRAPSRPETPPARPYAKRGAPERPHSLMPPGERSGPGGRPATRSRPLWRRTLSSAIRSTGCPARPSWRQRINEHVLEHNAAASRAQALPCSFSMPRGAIADAEGDQVEQRKASFRPDPGPQ